MPVLAALMRYDKLRIASSLLRIGWQYCVTGLMQYRCQIGEADPSDRLTAIEQAVGNHPDGVVQQIDRDRPPPPIPLRTLNIA